MKLLAIAAVILSLASFATAQERVDIHRVSGVVRNKEFAVVPGLSLSVEKDGKEYKRNGYAQGGFTDINGEFVLELEPGNYKITAIDVPPNVFALHLVIGEGPRPDDLDLILDTSSMCKSAFPSILKRVRPNYPPAARAVRAVGTVSLTVKVRADGSVNSAKAISGHPLLRKVSESAAEQFIFESSHDENRELTLAFIYLVSGEEKSGLTRFECPERIFVNSPPDIVNTTDN